MVSFKTGTATADELLARWRAGDVHVHECWGFENIEDRKKLVTGYLERHLKELDQTLLETLVTVPGAEMVKLGTAVTVKETVAVCVTPPPVPVTVTG